mgnify:CR=1 FL=1
MGVEVDHAVVGGHGPNVPLIFFLFLFFLSFVFVFVEAQVSKL